MLTRFRTRVSTVLMLAFSMVAMTAMAAFATTESAGVTAAKSALDTAESDATTLVTYGIPVVLGIAILWVALKFGKRLIGKL